MMKLTSNTVLINRRQGAADQRRSQMGGGRWKEKEAEAVIDCTACVFVVRRMMMGGCEEWRAGFAPRAAVKALCP